MKRGGKMVTEWDVNAKFQCWFCSAELSQTDEHRLGLAKLLTARINTQNHKELIYFIEILLYFILPPIIHGVSSLKFSHEHLSRELIDFYCFRKLEQIVQHSVASLTFDAYIGFWFRLRTESMILRLTWCIHRCWYSTDYVSFMFE